MSVSSTNTAKHSALLGIFARVYTSLTAGFSTALSFGTISHMSDAQLSDLGMTRYDVPRAAAADILNR